MKLNEYFETAKGTGVLATADAAGRVNAAVYTRPYFPDSQDEKTVAFIMEDRLSYANVQANPHAAYLFMEGGDDYAGKRLTLTKVKEERLPLAQLEKAAEAEAFQAARSEKSPQEEGTTRFLVCFRVDGVRPLIGSH